jgi:hypothetical protein
VSAGHRWSARAILDEPADVGGTPDGDAWAQLDCCGEAARPDAGPPRRLSDRDQAEDIRNPQKRYVIDWQIVRHG